MMRIALLAVVVLCACLALGQSPPYVIDSFITRIELHADATMDVEEVIQVQFHQARHGIFRSIPVVYDAGGGRKRAIQFRLKEVLDGSGRRQTTKVTREGDNIKIRIGDTDVMLAAGTEMIYIIRYAVFGAVNWHDGGDGWQPTAELYWNVTGDEWATSIGTAGFSIRFPDLAEDADVRGRVFTGGYGSSANVVINGFGETDTQNPAATELRLETGELIGRRHERLAPYEGLTVVLGLPAEAVPRPPWWVELWRRASEYLALLTPVVALAVLLPIWKRIGRDPPGGEAAVQFEPPDGIPAPEAGTLIDERVDQRDIAAGIMALAVKGYLLVETDEVGSVFKRKVVNLRLTDKRDTEGLPPFEATLYRYIKKGGDLVTQADLQKHVAPMIGSLRDKLYDQLVARGYYRRNPNSIRTSWMLGSAFGCIAVAFLLSQLSLIHELPVVIVGALLGLVPALWISWHMPMRKPIGSVVRAKVLGFYEMMRHRENYLKWVVETQPDGLKYEEYLPYAVAFDLIDQWNDAFKDIVREAPSWYVQPHGQAFYLASFGSDLSFMTSELGRSASMPPRSSGASGGGSGFGGGGFSGGGFGGGGGGSW
ncbi:MAG: DUF2207 domain-containing protein [Armatimonadetes bacterium]|nr:DUF2207 domain-containing protein [Armatimonadota bacterium]